MYTRLTDASQSCSDSSCLEDNKDREKVMNFLSDHLHYHLIQRYELRHKDFFLPKKIDNQPKKKNTQTSIENYAGNLVAKKGNIS